MWVSSRTVDDEVKALNENENENDTMVTMLSKGRDGRFIFAEGR